MGDQLADVRVDKHTETPAAVSSTAAAAPTVATLIERLIALHEKSLLPLNDRHSCGCTSV